jgi:hypothetical protein
MRVSSPSPRNRSRGQGEGRKKYYQPGGAYREISLNILTHIQPGKAFLAAIIFFATSCAGVVRGPDIESLIRDRGSDAPFMASGTVTVSGPGAGFSGSILLSMDGDKFRLEVLDAVNRAALAVAGESGAIIRIDPATGERRMTNSTSIRATELGGVVAPVGLLRTAALGSIPHFGKAVSTRGILGKTYVKTEDPSMELVFSGSLLSEVRLQTDEDDTVTLRLGPAVNHAPVGWLQWSQISLGSGAVLKVKWKKAETAQSFAPGFFTFEDTVEDF